MATAHGRVVRALRVERGDAGPTVDDLDRDYFVAMARAHRAQAEAARLHALAERADARRFDARGEARRAGTVLGYAWKRADEAASYETLAADYDRMAGASS